MQKICVVYSFKPSAWVSCQKIVANLLKAYEVHRDYELIPVPFADNMDHHEEWASVQIVLKERPTHVIILDHNPHCFHFIEPLVRKLKEINYQPTFIFHLYGDFTLSFTRWKQVEECLTGHQVLWYAASPRQRAMLGEFIPLEQMEICPFPVDHQEFFPDARLRESFRQEKNWPAGETVFLFTGRLSRQKRIHQLIETFARWQVRTSAKARLVLVGDADKHGEPFLLQGEYEGEYFHYLLSVLEAIPASVRPLIEVHGFRPNRELNAYYNGADVFVNISVHNDEDYGMSCAEALAAGMPMILTDWAGLAGFRRPGLEDAIRMVPVKLSLRGKLISTKALYRGLASMHQMQGQFDRAHIARASLAYTGIAPVAQIVKRGLGLSHLYKSFRPLFHEAHRREAYQKWNTFADLRAKTFNDLYMTVYRHYVE